MNLFKHCFIITIFGSSLAFGQFGQSGLLEYKVYSRGGNSSFTSVDTVGMPEEDIDFIGENLVYGTPTDDHQSGLFEYETTGLGGNSSFIAVDESGFNRVDEDKATEVSKVIFPDKKSEVEVAKTLKLSEIAVKNKDY